MLVLELRKKRKSSNLFNCFHFSSGTSITLVPDALLHKQVTKTLNIVEEQRVPNGDFPTVKSPNPEEPEALTLALALADKTNNRHQWWEPT